MNVVESAHRGSRSLSARPRPGGRNAATIINTNGGRYGAAIVDEARRARLPLALACALVEQESSFRNIFGADAVPNPIEKHSPVTEESYKRYKRWRDQGKGNQGCGIVQLTWKGYQDAADKLGGCWKVENQLRIGFGALAASIAKSGLRQALSLYNTGSATGAAGQRYASQVLVKRERWRKLLTNASSTPKPKPKPGGARPGKPRGLRKGAHGPDVALLQRTLNTYLRKWGAPELLDRDGRLGNKTLLAFRRVRLVLGLTPVKDRSGRVLITPQDRIKLRHPERRIRTELQRARTLGTPYLRKLRARFRREKEARGRRPKIVRLALDFDTGRLARNVAIHTTVGHHSGVLKRDKSDADAAEMCKAWHHEHRHGRRWAGIGYHACIAKSGTIILLRPGWATGAGVEGHNTGTFHVVFPGDYRTHKPTAEQIASYRWFIKHGHELDGIPRQGKNRLGHKDFSGHHSNACPGTHLHPYVKGN